jgi:hypothetical protein
MLFFLQGSKKRIAQVFPIDFLTNVVGAYGLRELSSFGITPIRVVRSFDNAEADVFFDSTGEISNNSLVSTGGNLATFLATSTTGSVKVLYDQSGNSRDLIQNNLSLMPRIWNSGLIIINGKPSLDYYSAGQSLESSSSAFNINNFLTHLAVSRVTDVSITRAFLDYRFPSGNFPGYSFYNEPASNTTKMQWNNSNQSRDATLRSAMAINTMFCFISRATRNVNVVFKQNTSAPTSSNFNGFIDGTIPSGITFQFGGHPTNTSLSWRGQLNELIICSSLLSDTSVDQYFNNTASFYNII